MSLSEKSFIEQIRGRVRLGPGVALGIGDDCSVVKVPCGHDALVTTDFSLEDRHFRRKWHPPEFIGHRCLARGLSDIAAMGGMPIAAFLSLALPPKTPPTWARGFVSGLLRLAGRFRVILAGGDTSESPHGVLADIVVLGSVPKGKAILRSGAKPGDKIYVTGRLGGAAATLDLLRSGRKLRPADYPAHFSPRPRVKVGQFLGAAKLATAMIDISDGLSTDLNHICEESGVGAEIVSAAVPRGRIGKEASTVELRHALHGGDDYELLFTAPAHSPVPARIAGVPITLIGSITRGRGMFLLDVQGKRKVLEPRGWQHFRQS